MTDLGLEIEKLENLQHKNETESLHQIDYISSVLTSLEDSLQKHDLSKIRRTIANSNISRSVGSVSVQQQNFHASISKFLRYLDNSCNSAVSVFPAATEAELKSLDCFIANHMTLCGHDEVVNSMMRECHQADLVSDIQKSVKWNYNESQDSLSIIMKAVHERDIDFIESWMSNHGMIRCSNDNSELTFPPISHEKVVNWKSMEFKFRKIQFLLLLLNHSSFTADGLLSWVRCRLHPFALEFPVEIGKLLGLMLFQVSSSVGSSPYLQDSTLSMDSAWTSFSDQFCQEARVICGYSSRSQLELVLQAGYASYQSIIRMSSILPSQPRPSSQASCINAPFSTPLGRSSSITQDDIDEEKFPSDIDRARSNSEAESSPVVRALSRMVRSSSMTSPVVPSLSTRSPPSSSMDVIREQPASMQIATSVPPELALDKSLQFHSIFSCPVSRDISNPIDNPPILLKCGHVVCKNSLNGIRRFGSIHSRYAPGTSRFKCPTCNQDMTIEDTREIIL